MAGKPRELVAALNDVINAGKAPGDAAKAHGLS